MVDPRKQTPNDHLESHNFGGIQFRVEKREDDGGVNSPPLWKNNPPIINYGSLSPGSRAKAIARGQWELMEMVKDMPESSYELSLKDLVEQPYQEECLIKIKRKNDQNKAKMMRSKSIENGGFLLKMGLPLSLRSKKKKLVKKTKVSPKPEESDSTSVDKEWWKKRLISGSSGSSNSTSTCSRNNSNRKREGALSSCWARLYASLTNCA